MAHLNCPGPENEGPKTGRMLGRCYKTSEEKIEMRHYRLGEGLGRKRNSNCPESLKKRTKASDLLNK